MSTDHPTPYSNSTGPLGPQNGYYSHPESARYPTAYDPGAQMQNPYYPTHIPGAYPTNMQWSAPLYVPPQSGYPVSTLGMPGTNHPTVLRPPNEQVATGRQYRGSAYPQYPQMVPPQSTNIYGPNYMVPGQNFAHTTTVYNAATNPQHIEQFQPRAQQPLQKREKNVLQIRDPKSNEIVELSQNASQSSTNSHSEQQSHRESTSRSTEHDPSSTEQSEKDKKQSAFRQDFAQLLAQDGNVSEKSTAVSMQKEKPPAAVSRVSNSKSHSETTLPNEPVNTTQTVNQPPTDQPTVVTQSASEEKSNNNEMKTNSSEENSNESNVKLEEPIDSSQKTSDDKSNEHESVNDEVQSSTLTSNLDSQSKSSDPVSTSESGPKPITATQSASKRASYSIEELLKKRTDPISRMRPNNLIFVPGVTNPPSMTPRDNITLAPPPPLQNRASNPYMVSDRNQIDANKKFLRDVTSILNKVTPQTYSKLLQDLDSLELNSDKRLEGMISIIFTKAVDEPSFCSLYAEICKHFQRKQVTIPNENGETVKYFFRQILLTRCQKEFESDYRQDIDYDERQRAVDAISDEKQRKEAAENLQEELGKAKRRKLGNIFFIGELFKLQMLVETIMFDCVTYLLRDKADEEALECLCRLLTTIGKELDHKTEKTTKRADLEKNYRDLENIVSQRQTSARTRFMIEDLLALRKANWVARRAEVKPLTIDQIHEQARLTREQQERDQEKDRKQRRDYQYSNNSQQYTEGRGSRGSGMKQQPNRNEEDRGDLRSTVNSVKQLHITDKGGQGAATLSFAPKGTWSKGSGVDKKAEDSRPPSGLTGKPPSIPSSNSKTKAGYPNQRQASRELNREEHSRDYDNSRESLRRTTSGGSGASTPNVVGPSRSREGPNNTSREQSRNPSRESNVSEQTSNSKKLTSTMSNDSTTVSNENSSNATFDEEKTRHHVHSLVEEYSENYSDNDIRPVTEAIEDLTNFCTSNINQQSIIVQEFCNDVLEAKPIARKAVGHLLAAASQKKLLADSAIIDGFKTIFESAPDLAVDIPLIWQYIAEVIGAFLGASSNISILKEIMQLIPDGKSKQFLQHSIQFATEFSSKLQIQQLWQRSDLSFDDLLPSTSIDSSFTEEYSWLNQRESEKTKTTLSGDPKLIELFKSTSDRPLETENGEILEYIRQKMNNNDKYRIRKIVLSYLEACLINRDTQKKLNEAVTNKRIQILTTVIDHQQEAELQAVYAIQNFVHKLEHPNKMAQYLFDLFYEHECASEESFREWLKNPDPSEQEGHSIVEISTKDFFDWLDEDDEDDEEEES